MRINGKNKDEMENAPAGSGSAGAYLISESPSQRIYEAVKKIPRGCVATYGQVAEAAGNRKMARVVGNALHKNPDPANIPCHRVVNAKGELAVRYAFGGAEKQAEILMSEGVEVAEGRVDLRRFQWKEFAGNREKRD